MKAASRETGRFHFCCLSNIEIEYAARHLSMKAVFVELPAFERHRFSYMDDDGFRRLQAELMARIFS